MWTRSDAHPNIDLLVPLFGDKVLIPSNGAYLAIFVINITLWEI